jgi:PleD family two-component response regulator
MERLLQTADAALYQAKSEGRNCVRSRPMPSILSP